LWIEIYVLKKGKRGKKEKGKEKRSRKIDVFFAIYVYIIIKDNEYNISV
jgi:hypothetical protein